LPFYCEQEGRTFSIDQLADLVDTALSDFFYRTAAEPPDRARVLKADWRRKGQPVADVITDFIGYAAAENTAAEDIRCVLAERYNDIQQGEADSEEGPFDPGAYYAKGSADASDFEVDWHRFERSLKTEARCFNRTAEAILTSIFEGIDGYATINGRPIIVDAEPGTVLYRARVFQAESKLREAMKRPDKDVGPPPTSHAVANRMNAAGVAVFYGATDPIVALNEVRPPVGSKVLIGRFEVIRPLRLLDLEALESVADETGSVFDDGYRHRMKRAEFLRGLSRRISRPVMPDDEPCDYLPTQAIADFLGTALEPQLDGMLYPSVQSGHLRRTHPGRTLLGLGSRDSRNVVLFHKAARVRPLDIPDGADIIVYPSSSLYGFSLFPESLADLGDVSGFPDDDDPEVTYTVWEEARAQERQVASTAPSPEADDAPLKFLDLEYRYVRSVTFATVPSRVPRYRVEKRAQAETL
jgi:hypothetical protein